MEEYIKIRVASEEDLDGILELQSKNQASQGGSLSGEIGRAQMIAMMKDMPQIIALFDGKIVGYLLTTSQTVYQKQPVPILDAMFTSYSGTATSYVYGPICVSQDQRGKGLAQLMFKKLLQQVPNREGILFIRRDNEPSLRAHEKMGIQKVGNFLFNDAAFDVLAYLPVPTEENIVARS